MGTEAEVEDGTEEGEEEKDQDPTCFGGSGHTRVDYLRGGRRREEVRGGGGL